MTRSAAEREPGTRDAEHFGREEDRWHQDADRAKRKAADTPLDALVDALYEDRCLPPPQTDHALHVIAALRRRGFVIAGATAAVPLDVDKMKEEIRLNSVSAAAHLVPATDWISLPVLGRILDRLSASANEEGGTP